VQQTFLLLLFVHNLQTVFCFRDRVRPGRPMLEKQLGNSSRSRRVAIAIRGESVKSTRRASPRIGSVAGFAV
jgi:hypothetical protein